MKPGEHKTVQARILAYAQEIGWTVVSREQAEQRRGFDPAVPPALGVDQIRRYLRETPELFVSQQLFTATDAIGFSYRVTWNTVRRNIFNWKDEVVGKLEAKVKSSCAIGQLLAFLNDLFRVLEKPDRI